MSRAFHSWSREGLGGPRTQLYMQAIFAIEEARPRAFLLESSDQLPIVEKGKLAEAITNKLKQLQYCLHATVINTSNYGLPQNRSRFWIVGIRKDVLGYPFKWPEQLPTISLEELLIPKDHDQGHPDILPSAKLAAQQTQAAATYAAEYGTTGDWIIAEQCSNTFMPNPRPSTISPTLTTAKRNGHWIGTRGRRLTYKEAARLQGYDTRCFALDPQPSNNHYLIGNTVSAPVLERLWIATQRAQGCAIEDPWTNGVRQAQLIEAAKHDRLTPTQLLKQRAATGSVNRQKKANQTYTPQQCS